MRFRITCIVDNTARLGSQLWAEHGLSLLVSSTDGQVLLDTGQSTTVIRHNLTVLDEPLEQLRAVVLSHGHYDHTGGLRHILGQQDAVALVAHPGVFHERYARDADGSLRTVGMSLSRSWCEEHAHLQLRAEPVEVAPGVTTTGPIPRGHGPEPRDPRLVVRNGASTCADPFDDDQSLVIDAEPGLIVLLGCCHAGLVNTLQHVRNTFGRTIHTVIGGTHLAGAGPTELQEVMAAVENEYQVAKLVLGHCTGLNALVSFAQALPNQVEPCAAGLQLEL